MGLIGETPQVAFRTTSGTSARLLTGAAFAPGASHRAAICAEAIPLRLECLIALMPQSRVALGFSARGSDHVPGIVNAGQENLDARSIPITEPGRARAAGAARSTSTVNDTNHRWAVRETVADRMRAVPLASLRASLRVDSWLRTVPSRGSVTVVPAHRMTPAPNRNESLHRPPFELWEPEPAALRSPRFDRGSVQRFLRC